MPHIIHRNHGPRASSYLETPPFAIRRCECGLPKPVMLYHGAQRGACAEGNHSVHQGVAQVGVRVEALWRQAPDVEDGDEGCEVEGSEAPEGHRFFFPDGCDALRPGFFFGGGRSR
jgi:hypothetical protein